MNANAEKELKELLENISDTYEDFVIGVAPFCRTDEERLKIIDYIKGKPDVTTSDVLAYYHEEIKLKRK